MADFPPVTAANLRVSRHPGGVFITVKGEVEFLDSRRLDVREAITIEGEGTTHECLAHKNRYPPSAFARRFRYMDGADQLVRLEDDIHGLHYHYFDAGKACCSRDKTRIALTDGYGRPVADRLTMLDFIEVVDRSYYTGKDRFCKQFTDMGLVANSVR